MFLNAYSVIIPHVANVDATSTMLYVALLISEPEQLQEHFSKYVAFSVHLRKANVYFKFGHKFGTHEMIEKNAVHNKVI